VQEEEEEEHQQQQQIWYCKTVTANMHRPLVGERVEKFGRSLKRKKRYRKSDKGILHK